MAHTVKLHSFNIFLTLHTLKKKYMYHMVTVMENMDPFTECVKFMTFGSVEKV